jgi:hypothetical protein
MPATRHHAWDLSAATCERGGDAPIRLRVAITLSAGDDPVLEAVHLTATGPGVTCGAKWGPTWAERAVAKLGWVGLPLRTILARPAPTDAYTCACTEISLAPKLWHLLRQTAPSDAPPL